MFRDCDYIKTRDGVIFIVLGDLHPQGKVRAAGVYFPTGNGDRYDKSTGRKYIKKIEQFVSPELITSGAHPEYLPNRKDPLKIGFLVPIGDIVEHYKPRERLKELLENDILKGTPWKKLILNISEIAKIPIKEIGIYGSLLVGLNKDISDVDILVYGLENLKKLRSNFEAVLLKSGVSKASKQQRMARVATWEKYSPIDTDRLRRMESRRWSRINVYGDNISSIRFAYGDDEVPNNSITSAPIKEIMVKGKVIESLRTHFFPRVANVIVEGHPMEVISHHFLTFSCVSNGDEVEIFGNYRKEGSREYITLDNRNHFISPYKL